MKKCVLFSFLIVSYLLSSAHDHCGTDILRAKDLAKDPKLIQKMRADEKRVQQKIWYQKIHKSPEEIYTIPVVVHVIHTGEEIGVGHNISDAQIISGINQINEAFRNTNADGVDTRIQIALATMSPDCEFTTGIVRVNAAHLSAYVNEGVNLQTEDKGVDENVIRGLSRWPVANYFNIYLINEIDDNNGGGGVQGYARFPNVPNEVYDTFILNNAWGDQGTVLFWKNQGKLGIHEMGHAFGLFHTFEGDDSGESCPLTDDGCGHGEGDCCDDTAPHIRSASNCPIGTQNICTAATIDDVIHNYMDYSSQNCMYKFTTDQKNRMRSSIESFRSELINSKALSTEYLSFESPKAPNCIPLTHPDFGLDGLYGGIKKVSIANLQHSSGYPLQDNPTEGYLDITQECINAAFVEAEESIEIAIDFYLNFNYVRSWIDYNDNGVFENDELILSGTAPSNGSYSQQITFPQSAEKNKFLRMRVLHDLSSFTSPCHNPQYGQGIDYAIFISEASNLPTADFTISIGETCSGDSVQFTDLSQGEVIDWKWYLNDSLVATNVQPKLASIIAGEYTVKLVVENQHGLDSITKANYLVVHPLPILTLIDGYTENYTTLEEDVVLNLALPSGGVYSGNGVTMDSIFNPQSAGEGTHQITYTFTNQWDCKDSLSFNLMVSDLTTITNISSQEIKVYPNPFHDLISIELSPSAKVEQLYLTDVSGRLIQSIHLANRAQIVLDSQGLSKGYYFIQVIGNKKIQSIPVVKN